VINPSTKTPIFSILIAGFIVVIAVTIRDLEHISTVTSIFSLTGYSLVNVALMIFRKKQPHLERKFKAPLYPLTPILGILVNLFLIYQLALSDVLALTIAVSIILLGLLYYYIGIPKLKSAPKGMSTLDVPHLNLNGNEKGNGNKKIFIPIANPKNIDSLVHFGSQIAMKEKGTSLVPLHVANATNAIPMDVTYDELQQTLDSDEILTKLVGLEKKESFIKPLVVFSRDIGHGIVSTLKGSTSPLLLMGWHSSGLAYNMNGGIVSRMLDEAPADIGILKDNNLKDVKKILFPYGGGRYSQLTASIVKRIADAFDAEVTVVRMVDELADEQEIENQVRQAMGALGKDVQIKIIEGNLTSEAVKLSKDYDLLILGASLDWGLKEYITGLRSDEIVEKAQCSTLVVKSYSSALQRKGVRQHLHNFKRLLQKNV
jgi:nucleotide-binding universal stress UspA family protein